MAGVAAGTAQLSARCDPIRVPPVGVACSQAGERRRSAPIASPSSRFAARPGWPPRERPSPPPPPPVSARSASLRRPPSGRAAPRSAPPITGDSTPDVARYGGSVDASAAHRHPHVRPDALPHRKPQTLLPKSPAGPALVLRGITAFSRNISSLLEEDFRAENPRRESRAPIGVAHFGGPVDVSAAHRRAHAAHRHAHSRPDAVPHHKPQSRNPKNPVGLRRIIAFRLGYFYSSLAGQLRPDAVPHLGFEGQGQCSGPCS